MIERQCTECGQAFRGNMRRCRSCQAIERDCDGCGRTFRGVYRYCQACWRAALPPGEWEARARSYGNSRRARKEAAQVAGPVPAEVYAAIRASGPCVYCGAEGTTVDHVRPLSRGGHEAEYNLVPACPSCNFSKNDSLLTAWRPDRVAYAVAQSPKVEAEYVRLLSLDEPGGEDIEGGESDGRRDGAAAA
jgi:5-methylcytosine-specific restriction endonuclease McrA